jgi:hypothetical protein
MACREERTAPRREAWMDVAYSVNGVPIRLPYERWRHIVENHDDMAGYFDEVLDTIEKPALVLRAAGGAYKAARNMGRFRWLVVFYKETSGRDGFVITAYFLDARPRGEVVWRP